MATIKDYRKSVEELARLLVASRGTVEEVGGALIRVLDAHAARVKQDVRAMMENSPTDLHGVRL